MLRSQRGKREKWRMGKKRTGLLSPLIVSLARREGLATVGGSVTTVDALCFASTAEIRNSNQWPDCRPLISGGEGPFCSPWLPQAVCKLLQEHCTAACHGSRGEGSWYCAKSQNRPKLTVIYYPSFRWKLQTFSRLQTFKIITSNRLCQCSCCLERETNFQNSLSPFMQIL